ncbi:MAG: hypothetical protein ACYTGH_21445, partial [Planctomycetota bacterium]
MPGLEDKAEFSLVGKKRFRWRMSPLQLLRGARWARLAGVANRSKNRYSIVLQELRHPDESHWADPLELSLREEA